MDKILREAEIFAVVVVGTTLVAMFTGGILAFAKDLDVIRYAGIGAIIGLVLSAAAAGLAGMISGQTGRTQRDL